MLEVEVGGLSGPETRFPAMGGGVGFSGDDSAWIDDDSVRVRLARNPSN